MSCMNYVASKEITLYGGDEEKKTKVPYCTKHRHRLSEEEAKMCEMWEGHFGHCWKPKLEDK